MPSIQLNNTSKRFKTDAGWVDALAPIRLQVKAGEFVCIVGPSGCGKSTLFNLIAGLEKPQTGLVKVDGKLGFMFQESALFPWLTVAENIAFGLKLQKLNKSAIAKKVDEYLHLVHLDSFGGSYPHELSGGMKQRAALARTLILEPDILLMDEPFAALDAQTRGLLQEQVQTIWQETGKTIVFITHDVREAIFLGSRVIVFTARPGKIKSEHSITVPRPRQLFDPTLDELGKTIAASLREEI